MTSKEKKSFLAAMLLQISLYESNIGVHRRHSGSLSACAICECYIIKVEGEWYNPKKSCVNCPNVNFRIYDFDDAQMYYCAHRKTYPSQINGKLDMHQIRDYDYQGEKAAKEFWKAIYKLAKKTATKDI